MSNPIYITTGYVDGTPIQTDATSISGATTITLTANYTRPPLGSWPPGWPQVLSWCGSEFQRDDVPGAVLESGLTLTFVASEAAALIAANAAVAA